MGITECLFSLNVWLSILVLLFRSQEERLSWTPTATCVYEIPSNSADSGNCLQRQGPDRVADNWPSPFSHALEGDPEVE